MKIGIIGLGLMGRNISLRLLKKDYLVNVYNRNSSKLGSLERQGAEIFNSPKEVTNNSDFVIICVTNFEAVNKISFHINGISETDNKNAIIADFSTISPNESIYCHKKFQEKNLPLLSIPVMGGPSAALEGNLIPIVSGEERFFKPIKTILEALGTPIFYKGNRIGSANALKLALNLNIALISMALSEGLLLSNKYEIDPNLYLKILNSSNIKTGMSVNKGPKMIKDDYHPTFHLKNMKKDLALVIEAANQKELSLPVTNITFQMYNYATNSMFANLDYTGIYKFLKKLNGID